jgi:phosphoglycerol transferase
VANISPAYADISGLRIIHLLIPVPDHRLPLFALMSSRVRSVTPLSDGAAMAPIGMIGSIGFLILIAIALWRPLGRNSRELDTLATWNLAALLLSTVGGFGAVFAWTISSSIRSYSRMSVFIALFSFAALLIVVQKFQIRRLKSAVAIRVYYSVIGVLILGGLWDLVPPQSIGVDAIRASVENDRNFVRTMESSLPRGAMVLQLPYDPFPEAGNLNRMSRYDHMRGYLYSHNLRWSFGVMQGRDEDIWERNTAGMVLTDMLPIVRRAGFKAIYIDRFGYSDDGQYICGRLSALLGQAPIESADRRLVFYKLL